MHSMCFRVSRAYLKQIKHLYLQTLWINLWKTIFLQMHDRWFRRLNDSLFWKLESLNLNTMRFDWGIALHYKLGVGEFWHSNKFMYDRSKNEESISTADFYLCVIISLMFKLIPRIAYLLTGFTNIFKESTLFCFLHVSISYFILKGFFKISICGGYCFPFISFIIMTVFVVR